MTKFKAILCTSFLALIIAAAIYGSTFVPTSPTGANLTIVILVAMAVRQYSHILASFYKWVTKQETMKQ